MLDFQQRDRAITTQGDEQPLSDTPGQAQPPLAPQALSVTHEGTGCVNSREETPTKLGTPNRPTTDPDTPPEQRDTATPDGQTTKATSTAGTDEGQGDVTSAIPGSRETPDNAVTHPVVRDSIAGENGDVTEAVLGVGMPPEQANGKPGADGMNGRDAVAAVAGVVKATCSAGLVLPSVGRDLVAEADLMERLGRLVCEGALIEVVDVHKEVSVIFAVSYTSSCVAVFTVLTIHFYLGTCTR